MKEYVPRPLVQALVILSLCLPLGFANAGIVGYFFPNSVIKGMLSAIGIIIFIKQIPHALGLPVGYDGGLTGIFGT